MVHVGHRRGDGVVTRCLVDGPMKLLGNSSVGRMALGAGSELDDVHGLTGVHLEHEADPEGQGHGVGRLGREVREEGGVELLGPGQ